MDCWGPQDPCGRCVSQDLRPESEPILCCIWPARTDQSGCRKGNQKTNQVAPCNPNFDPLPNHCWPLSFACNPYQFLRKTSRKSLVRFVLSHPQNEPRIGLLDIFSDYEHPPSHLVLPKTFLVCLQMQIYFLCPFDFQMSDKQCNQIRRTLLNSKIWFLRQTQTTFFQKSPKGICQDPFTSKFATVFL